MEELELKQEQEPEPGDPGILPTWVQWKTGTFQVARHKEQLKGVCIFINAIA